MMKSEKSSKPPFCAAACELAQGFIPVLGLFLMMSHVSLLVTCSSVVR